MSECERECVYVCMLADVRTYLDWRHWSSKCLTNHRGAPVIRHGSVVQVIFSYSAGRGELRRSAVVCCTQYWNIVDWWSCKGVYVYVHTYKTHIHVYTVYDIKLDSTSTTQSVCLHRMCTYYSNKYM